MKILLILAVVICIFLESYVVIRILANKMAKNELDMAREKRERQKQVRKDLGIKDEDKNKVR
jgi:predicted Holliday junction resolvase-like endonuclease